MAFDYLGQRLSSATNSQGKGIWNVDGPVLRKFAGLSGIADIQTHAFANGKIWICYVRGMEVINAETGKQEGGHLYFRQKHIGIFN
ncbi:MAG: hypothetical protein IPN95_11875 [Bacteroidetes bacterium]|nr:hypothetical protein [Bacteroidota bacterium]